MHPIPNTGLMNSSHTTDFIIDNLAPTRKESHSIFLKKTILTICLTVVYTVLGFSQETFTSEEQKEKNIWQLAGYDGKAALGGLLYAYSRPAHWDKDDWITFGAIAGGTALLYFVDDETSEFFRRQEESTPSFLLEFGDRFGSPQVAYGLTGSIYLVGLFTKNEKIRKTGVLMISSATVAGLIQTVTKTTVGRSRPGNGLDKFDFNSFSGEPGFRSFPSGHTILAFTFAHALARQFDNIWIKTGIYAVGVVSPISRVVNGAHWLTDVALSMAISVVTVNAIDNYLNKKAYYPGTDLDIRPKNGISWNFNMGLGRIGITGTF